MEPEKRKDRFLFWGQGLLILGLALAALWCFWHLARGFILNLISFPFFVLLPGLMITRMILLLRSRRSVGAKVRRCAICAVLLICSLVFGMFSPYQIHRSTQENARERFAAVFHFFCLRIRRPTGRAYPTGRVYRKAAPMYRQPRPTGRARHTARLRRCIRRRKRKKQETICAARQRAERRTSWDLQSTTRTILSASWSG